MYRHNRKTLVSKTFRDYLVPFVWLLLIIILIISFLSWWDKEKIMNHENKIWINVNLNWENSSSYIEYIWGDKKEIAWNAEIYKWEKVFVKEWSLDLDFPWVLTMKLNKMWNLKFNEDWTFSLFASDLWIKTLTDIKLNVRFWELLIWKESVLSVTQNEVWSTIYLLKWVVEVKNIAWKSTMLWAWQKITISSIDWNKQDIDLSLLRNNLDDYFKGSDWYIKNNGDLYLNNNRGWKVKTWTWVENETVNLKQYISLDSLRDESQVSNSTITIKWNILNSSVSIIKINWIEANINLEEKTFELKELFLTNKINDIIFKIYNSNNEILNKKIYTIYYSWWEKKDVSKFKVENFSLDSTKFQFIFPKKNPFTTYTNLVTIEWKVPPWIVEKIVVNDYQLKQFPRNWSYWKYHANKDFWNLKEGLNIYKVDYYWPNKKLLHSNAFTIIKKVKSNIYSEEVKL